MGEEGESKISPLLLHCPQTFQLRWGGRMTIRKRKMIEVVHIGKLNLQEFLSLEQVQHIPTGKESRLINTPKEGIPPLKRQKKMGECWEWCNIEVHACVATAQKKKSRKKKLATSAYLHQKHYDNGSVAHFQNTVPPHRIHLFYCRSCLPIINTTPFLFGVRYEDRGIFSTE